jgi:IS5 family transposase
LFDGFVSVGSMQNFVVLLADLFIVLFVGISTSKGKDDNNTQDPEASYNVKTAADGKRKTTYGYKMHANTDEDGFVKKMSYTPGNVHDSQEFDKLLDTYKTKDKIKTCGEVYADSAYANKKNNEKIGKQNNKVLHRAYRNKPLTKQQKQDNKQRSSIRYVVERTFGLYSNFITA